LWAGISVVLPQWAITKQGAFMKNIKLLAIIAIVAVFGFTFIACGPDEEEEYVLTGDERAITVTGIPTTYNGKFGYVGISPISGTGVSAVSLPEPITNTNLSMDLYETQKKRFTGTGDFMVIFSIITDEDDLDSEIYSGYVSSKSITEVITYISFIDLIPLDINTSRPYIITGSAGSFKANKNGYDLSTTGAFQTVINAIRDDADGEDITIQFGNGTNTLNIGTVSNIEFKNEGSSTWGLITFTGKISGATAGSTVTPTSIYMLHIMDNVSVTSSADITNTAHTAIRKYNAGTLTITGGTITGNSLYAGVVVQGATATTTANIEGGTISAGTGADCSATMNISGGTITGSITAVEINNNADRLNITGGTLTGTGSGRGILLTNGVVVLSGNASITSATTAADRATIQLSSVTSDPNTNSTVLTINGNVTITNTGANGKVVYNPQNWKIVDNRVNPPGGNLTAN
jgi:hypothetical protein